MNVFSVSDNAYRIAITDRILDSVHGQIGMTPVEVKIEIKPIFKRLHNISQLGLVNRIFPCAVHTRYTHSLGVMHVVALMAESINGKFSTPFFDDDDIQVLRLAGLLHDIGHYPMSHNVEMVYRASLRAKESINGQLKTYVNCPDGLNPQETEPDKNKTSLKDYAGPSQEMHHEWIGHDIIMHNKDLFDVVKWNYILIHDNETGCDDDSCRNPEHYKLNRRYAYDLANGKTVYDEDDVDEIVKSVMSTIANIVIGNYSYQDRQIKKAVKYDFFPKYSAMVQLIHSELDADNIDYLLRDASFSGTSYGTMDMSLLISALTVSKLSYEFTDECGKEYEGERYFVGILKKRLGCVEQFLVSKYMAYSQVVFSKYVSCLEAMLFRMSIKLFSSSSEYSKKKIKDMVKRKETQREYLDFNDSYILHCIRTIEDGRGEYSEIPSPDHEIVVQINNNLAFNMDSEVSSVSLNKDKLYSTIKESDLYKEFVNICDSLGDQNEKQLKNDELLKNLISFRFESYNLTKQLPLAVFEEEYQNDLLTPSLEYQSRYYRAANGIPILETNKQYVFRKKNGEPNILELPDLVVDTPSSLLRDIYSLGFVYLRKYKIENDKPEESVC